MKINFKRISILLCIIIICFSFFVACQSDTLPSSSKLDENIDRYEQIFDSSNDKGKLVTRFFKIETGTDTKSGDCALVISPDGETMLVDAGAPECGEQIIKYLKELDITKIDYLVASHPHIDHIGGMPEIINNFDIGAVYTTRLEYPTQTYDRFNQAIEDNQLEVIYVEEGMTFKFGNFVDVEIFNPISKIEYYENYPEGSTQFVNNLSAVIKLTYQNRSILFTGDVYATQELKLVQKYGEKLKADILKIPHHGSDTSSTSTFIKAVKPQVGVMINDGIDSLAIYKRYKKQNCDTYITYIDGCVKVSTNGKDITVLTQFNRKNDFLD